MMMRIGRTGDVGSKRLMGIIELASGFRPLE